VIVGGDEAVLPRDVAEDSFLGIAEGLDLRGDHAELRVTFERAALGVEAAGERDVVGVHARDEIATAEGEAVGEGARNAARGGRRGAESNAGVLCCERVGARQARVGRGVVDENELVVVGHVGEDAACGLFEGGLRVAKGQKDRDHGVMRPFLITDSRAAKLEGFRVSERDVMGKRLARKVFFVTF